MELARKVLPEDKRTPENIDALAKKYWDNYVLNGIFIPIYFLEYYI
jgi:hypothetical protein